MAKHDKSIAVEQVACAVCLKEVPISEATVPEALDYVVHFCGLGCYEQWKKHVDKPKQPGEKHRP